jgi:hypothetical protein
LAHTWLPASCVLCYRWSIYWIFIMCLKKVGEFSFPSTLIMFTSVILNSSNKLLKSGTSFLLVLYISSGYCAVLRSEICRWRESFKIYMKRIRTCN